jgi:EpsI family protein
LLAASGAAFALAPVQAGLDMAEGALEGAIPRRIGDYRFATTTGLVLPDEERARAYDQVLTRIYIAEGRPSVMLAIAYGSAQDAGLAVHRPEACYPSAGYSVTRPQPTALAGLSMNGKAATFLSAERGDRAEQIYYWTRVGDRFPTSPAEEKVEVLAANLRGTMPDGVLVRLSMLSREPEWALEQLQAFNRTMLDGLGAEGRAILLGPDGTAHG